MVPFFVTLSLALNFYVEYEGIFDFFM